MDSQNHCLKKTYNRLAHHDCHIHCPRMSTEYDPKVAEDVFPEPSYGGNPTERAGTYGFKQAPTMAERVSLDTFGMDGPSNGQPVTSYPHEGPCAVTPSNYVHHMDNAAWSYTHQQCAVAVKCIDPRLILVNAEVDILQIMEQENIPPVPMTDARSDTAAFLQDSDPGFAAALSTHELPQDFHAGSLPTDMSAQQLNAMLGISLQSSHDPWQPPWVPGIDWHTNPRQGSFPEPSSTSDLGNRCWPSSSPVIATTPSTSLHTGPMSWGVGGFHVNPIPVHQNREVKSNIDPSQHSRAPQLGKGRISHPCLRTRAECDLAASSRLQGPAAVARHRSFSDRLSVPGDPMQTFDAPSPTPSEISITPSDVSDILACQIDGCEAQFTGLYRRGNFCRHKRLIHNKARFPCSINGCESIFKRQDALLKHHRKHHRYDLPLLKPPEPRKHRKSF